MGTVHIDQKSGGGGNSPIVTRYTGTGADVTIPLPETAMFVIVVGGGFMAFLTRGEQASCVIGKNPEWSGYCVGNNTLEWTETSVKIFGTGGVLLSDKVTPSLLPSGAMLKPLNLCKENTDYTVLIF